jgi:hypothetical protein
VNPVIADSSFPATFVIQGVTLLCRLKLKVRERVRPNPGYVNKTLQNVRNYCWSPGQKLTGATRFGDELLEWHRRHLTIDAFKRQKLVSGGSCATLCKMFKLVTVNPLAPEFFF